MSAGHLRGSRIGACPSPEPDPQTPAACEQAAVSSDAASGVTLVRSTRDLRSFEAYLLGHRDRPVIALTPSRSGGPVLAPQDVRRIVGARCAIYLIRGEHLLRRLQGVLGSPLTVRLGEARIWWPGLTTRSDPADHPSVQPAEGGDPQDTLAEFARQFDLSRPSVRAERDRNENGGLVR
jgi:hypothetical protein